MAALPPSARDESRTGKGNKHRQECRCHTSKTQPRAAVLQLFHRKEFMAEPRNMAIDHSWKPDLGARGMNHEFKNGEYVEVSYTQREFPKFKYHADYVHDKKDGVEYPFTTQAQLVNNAEEEAELGAGWKDSPADYGIVTAPDAEEVSKRKRAKAATGSNWRAATSLPAVSVSEHHIAFLQSQGMDISSLAQAYTFLATLTSTQMKSFMEEAASWKNGSSAGKGANGASAQTQAGAAVVHEKVKKSKERARA